jgi:hypothetical protein
VRGTSRFSGQIPVRFDGAPGGPLAGLGMWRGVTEFDHGVLCRTFNLDPCRFYFDLPSSVRGVGSLQSGAGGSSRGNRMINGFVMMSGQDKPVGKLTIVTGGDRFKDVDPQGERDFFDLSHS